MLQDRRVAVYRHASNAALAIMGNQLQFARYFICLLFRASFGAYGEIKLVSPDRKAIFKDNIFAN